MYVAIHAGLIPMNNWKRVSDFPGTGVTVGQELPLWYSKSISGLLQEEQVLLTTDSSLQPLFFTFIFTSFLPKKSN